MPRVLTKVDSISCTVGNGIVSPTGDSKLLVAGSDVLTVAKLQGQAVSGCVPPGSPPPPSCASVGTIISGSSTKLIVSGSPALLDQTSASSNTPPGHPIGPISATQSKREAQ
jgi:hypothetical protein